ncbi:MAG: PAS domain-containing sensor histidine kinase [Salinivirgaceae bacterium]|jgi:two-component system sensor histidine kinase/response regulator|nr:PAS domain-containing sensor histidine kinase [Salinivirgaceae bacterium]
MKKLSFKNRIRSGFILVIVILMGTIFYTIWQLLAISQKMELVYEHPYKVSIAIRDIQIDMYKILRLEGNIPLADTKNKLDSLIAKIHESERLYAQNLNAIKNQYLGNKSDVDSIFDALSEWKFTINDLYRLRRENKQDSLDFKIKYKNHNNVDHIIYHIKIISDYASKKAETAMRLALHKKDDTLNTLYVILIIATLLVLLLSYFISKSISQPIRKFVSQANAIFTTQNEKPDLKFNNEEDLFDYSIKELRLAYQNIEQQNEEIRSNNEQLDILNNSLKEKVIHTEQLFHKAIALAPYPLMIHSNGEVIQLSNVWTEITGYKIEDIPIIEMWAEKAYGKNDVPSKEFIYKLYELEGLQYDGEWEINLKNGETRIWDFSTSPLGLIANGEKAVISMAIDITERKQAEHRIKESEEKFHALFSEMAEGVYLHEIIYNQKGEALDYRILEANTAAEKLLNIKSEDSIGKLATELYGTKEAPFIDIYKKVAETGINIQFEEYFQPLKKHFHISVYSPQKGKFATIFSDITERKQAEQALKESEKKYRLLYESNLMPISIFDSETLNFLSVNNAFIDKYGYTREEFLNMTILEIRSDSEIGKLEESVKIADKGLVNAGVFFHKKKNGEIMQVEIISCDLVFDEKNAKLVFVNDVTDKMKAELIIQKQNEELLKLNSDKDRLLSIIGHDLKSPFVTIIGFTEMLIKNISIKDMSEIEEYAHYINQASTKAFKLLEDLLSWAKAQSGKVSFFPQKLDLNTICNDAMNAFMPGAIKKNININYLPNNDFTVIADSNMLKTVLRNLISNAIKFTNPGGTITIDAEQNISKVTISVTDNGVGMTPKEVSMLFDVAQTHSTPGTENEKGTGLGLLLCKEFVEKHGGKIWVESEVGNLPTDRHGKAGGSSFIFTLPQRE